jgi:hypothetical protein
MCFRRFSEKNPLFPCSALTDWFFTTETDSLYCEIRFESLNIIQADLSV